MKEFKTESKRILDLMINSIYTNKEIFLRELISNASDAMDKLKFISLTDKDVKSNFEINISVNKDARQIVIEDGGIGMSYDELEKNLGTIAESGTLQFKKDNEANKDAELIGQFGVGFYSAFMVASKVEVYSKAYKQEQAYKWESEGTDGYTIEKTDKEDVGSKIVITLKPDDEDYKYSDLLEEYKITSLIKDYSDYIHYPIKMMKTHSRKKEGTPDDKPEYEDYSELETLNSMIPIWKKPKAEVTTEKLNEFYKDTFHDYTDPIKSVYAKIEGMLEYNTLLFIPSHAPYDYFSKDYKRGVKLYCNGVLIMENCDSLIPEYYSFIKGVVDSNDLSLNISREMLQQDKQVKAIATSLEKKITAELKKMLEEERENYEKMFKEFGLTLKFGVYNGFGMKKDLLKDLIMFYSSAEKKLVTLSEYVKRMKEGQDTIYYVCGENYEKIDKLPQTEQAKDKGFEILYLKDNVDEFVLKVLDTYEDKKFKSVSEADFSLDSESEKEKITEKTTENKELLDFLKETLKGKVKDVKLSNKLKTYPACLTASGDISIEMEKVLNSMPNNEKSVSAEKVLELNAEHRLLGKLKDLMATDKDTVKKYANVLYDSARLLEGLPIEDVTEYVTLVSEII